MEWTDGPGPNRFSLLDKSGSAILGQVIRDPLAGWQGHDYVANNGLGKHLGLFDTALQAKDAVESSIEKAGVNAQ
jgi:hypothetical protein